MKQTLFTLVVLCIFITVAHGQTPPLESYLSWSADEAENIGKSMRKGGNIGKAFDLRGIHTDRAINYKLRITWLSPDVIRAAARLEQIKNRLSDQQTRDLVSEAEAVGGTVFKVEIDPREGSGVVPEDWRAILQPKDLRLGADGSVVGAKMPRLQNVKALSGAVRRDYAYDVFWVVFPLVDKLKNSVFPADASHLQLIVGIYNSEGRIDWPIPESIRAKTKELSRK